MKCPKCKKEDCKYDVQREKIRAHSQSKTPDRKDFNATCKCGWKGII